MRCDAIRYVNTLIDKYAMQFNTRQKLIPNVTNGNSFKLSSYNSYEVLHM